MQRAEEETAAAEAAQGAGAAPAARSRGRLGLLLVLLLAGLAAFHALVLAVGNLDDAYISFRYARNLAAGLGPVFNAGEHVEGYTNFSWVVLAAALIRVGLEPAWLMPLVGAACFVGAVLTTWRTARWLAGADAAPPLAGVVAALVVAASPSLAFYAGTGLETALFVWLLALCADAALRGRPRAFAVYVVFAFLTRPEAGLVGLLGFASLTADARRKGAWRGLAQGVALAGVLVAVYLAWKLAFFGALLPNTLRAKPGRWVDGVHYLWGFAPSFAGLLVAALPAVRSAPHRRLFAAFVAYAVAVVFEGGDWMRGARLLVPALPWLAVAVDAGVSFTLKAPLAGRGVLRLALPAAALASLGAALADAPKFREAADAMAAYDPKRVQIARALHDAGVRSIMTVDVGLPAYTLPDVVFIDLGGLTDATVARAAGPHLEKAVDAAYLVARDPDACLFLSRVPPIVDRARGTMSAAAYYPVEERVMAMREFGERYRIRDAFRLRDDYWIVWFARDRGPQRASSAK